METKIQVRFPHGVWVDFNGTFTGNVESVNGTVSALEVVMTGEEPSFFRTKQVTKTRMVPLYDFRRFEASKVQNPADYIK